MIGNDQRRGNNPSAALLAGGCVAVMGANMRLGDRRIALRLVPAFWCGAVFMGLFKYWFVCKGC